MNRHCTVWKLFPKRAGIKIYIIILANRANMVTPQTACLPFAVKFAKNVRKNVVNILIWNIAGLVPKRACAVLNSAHN